MASRLIVALVCLLNAVSTSEGFLAAKRPSLCASKKGTRGLVATATVPRSAAGAAWSPTSWQSYPIKQPPNYPDQVNDLYY